MVNPLGICVGDQITMTDGNPLTLLMQFTIASTWLSRPFCDLCWTWAMTKKCSFVILSHLDFRILCYCSITYPIMLLLCLKCQGGTKEEVLSTLFQPVINRIKWVINHYHGFSNAVTWLRTGTNTCLTGRAS